MKLQTLFTVEYNVPVCGAVRRRIRVRQRPMSRPMFQRMPRTTAVVGLACAVVLVGLRLSPDEADRADRQAENFEPGKVVQAVQAVQPVAAPVVTSADARGGDAPAPDLDGARAQQAAVRDALMRWADAWSRRDVAGYIAAYSGDYSGQAGERSAWERERRSRIEARRHIRVDLSDIEIEGGDDMVRVTFLQSYRSDALQETTRKTLTLMRDGQDRWLIVRES